MFAPRCVRAAVSIQGAEWYSDVGSGARADFGGLRGSGGIVSAPLVEQIANAVLYEGYLLYPYRASAVKNRQRWNFGVVAPQESMETQCLALGGSLTALSVKVRCLRLVERVGESWQEAGEGE